MTELHKWGENIEDICIYAASAMDCRLFLQFLSLYINAIHKTMKKWKLGSSTQTIMSKYPLKLHPYRTNDEIISQK